MKKQTIISLLMVLISMTAVAQKQANVWTFGKMTGLNFNGTSPLPISTSVPLGADYCHWCPHNPAGYNEGASSICDSAGHLLFYSNGERIWNRYNNVLPHGDSLMGNFSATQAALILPWPGSSTIFYVFTIDCFQDTFKDGLHYTVVDACLDYGRGDVVDGLKNVPLLDSTGEKLTAVKHANGRDYWIIAHKFWTDRFYAFRLTSTGITDTVVTQIGRMHIDSSMLNRPWGAIGTMTSSPDGRHIALVNGNVVSYLTELFDFDPATGILSNHIDLKTRESIFGNRNYQYGCAFSPGSNKLYIAGFVDTALTTSGNTVPVIAQYDLAMGTSFPDSIRNSLRWVKAANEDSFELALHLGLHPMSLQLGPDHKIYGSGNSQYLWVIEQPDLTGAACGARINTSFTVGRTQTLPNILPSYAYDNGLTGCDTEPLASIVPQSGAGIAVYPNPAKETFTIECPGNWSATLMDPTGRSRTTFTGTGTASFSKGDLAPGIYILTIKTKEASINRKFVVQ